MKTASLSPLLQSFFTDRLMTQRHASPHTIASYRDTFRLLLLFAKTQLKKLPWQLSLQDLDAPFIGAFLDQLEKHRHNSPRSRNLRLAAIRSFFQYVSFQQPDLSAHIQRVLAIPNKRQDRSLIDFLTRPEIEALLARPRSNHLVRTARSCPLEAGNPDRPPSLRDHQTSLCRCSVGTGCSCALPWKRPQGTLHPFDQTNGHRFAGLASRTRRIH